MVVPGGLVCIAGAKMGAREAKRKVQHPRLTAEWLQGDPSQHPLHGSVLPEALLPQLRGRINNPIWKQTSFLLSFL